MMLFFFFYPFEENGVDVKHNEGNYGEKSSWKLQFYSPLVILAAAAASASHTVIHFHAPSTAADGFSFWSNARL